MSLVLNVPFVCAVSYCFHIFHIIYNSCLCVPFPKHNIPLRKTYTKLQHKFWGTKHIYQITCPPTNPRTVATLEKCRSKRFS